MSNDYIKKEPTKTEKIIYELVMAQNSMEKGLWSTSTLVMVLGLLNKNKPEEIAELIVNGEETIKEFSKKINEVIKTLEEKKREGQDTPKQEAEKAA